MYHIIGLRADGKFEQLHDGDDRDEVFNTALDFASEYKQLFLAQQGFNIRELEFTPEVMYQPLKLIEGKYQPRIKR
jgi:hypothetical protein